MSCVHGGCREVDCPEITGLENHKGKPPNQSTGLLKNGARDGIELWQHQINSTSETLQSCRNVPNFMPTKSDSI
jgi:hypothetical protein